VSSELERLLRDAREALPVPDEEATQRGRHRAVASLRGKRRRTRALVLISAIVACVVALGITAGSLSAPDVTAAREPAVLGFVPEPGWFALQSPPPAIEGQQTVAVAANVPFAPDDVDDGLVEPSGLPYSTLLALPPDGIVIVATMSPATIPHVAPVSTSAYYRRVDLPLRIRDALPVLRWGAQVRPDQPTAQYHLPVHLRGYNVDVVVYFGTPRPSAALTRAAQRQLSAFVVRSEGVDARARPAALTSPAAPVTVVDRTYACNTVLLGGLHQIDIRGHAGDREGGQWGKLPYAAVTTGGWAGLLPGNPSPRDNTLIWITAGRATHDTAVDSEGEAFPVVTGGSLGVNRDLCRPVGAAVPLRSAGLRGGMVGVDTRIIECAAPRRVLVRLRGTTRGSAALHERARIFAATGATIGHAELAVRTPSGRLLAYAVVDQSGSSRQFTAPKGCVRER
jgi:hypothetical protein